MKQSRGVVRPILSGFGPLDLSSNLSGTTIYAGIAKNGKGDGLKTRSRRGPRVQISLPALCSVRVARPILSAFRQLPDSRYWKKAEDARSNRARSI